jgi:hypothetical protein
LPLRVKQQLRRQPDILSVKVCSPDGRLVWASRAPERIGKRFPSAVQGDLGETIREKRAHGSIGKIAVPDSILTKPGSPDEGEYELVKRHPFDGADIVSHFSRLRDTVPLIRHHHERWDGKGYPDQLAGDQIPSDACIIEPDEPAFGIAATG